jgi:hypothetical protein
MFGFVFVKIIKNQSVADISDFPYRQRFAQPAYVTRTMSFMFNGVR